MANVCRILWQNFGFGGNAKLTASSEASGYSVNWCKHQSRSKIWRSASGWSFLQGFNDVLVFEESTYPRVAYVTGEYATGALAAAAIETAMDNAGYPPSEYNPSLWLKADALQLKDGDVLTEWPDSSGNNRDLDTVVGTPTYYRSVLNGRPAVRFNDDGYLYAASNAVQYEDIDNTSNLGITIFAVAWVDTDHTGYDTLWTQAGTNRGQFVDTNDYLMSRAYDGTQDEAQGDASMVGGWHLFVYQLENAVDVAGFEDNVDAPADTQATGTQSDLAQDFYVGGNGVDHLKGYIAELVVFPDNMTTAKMREIAAYFEQKYNIDTGSTAPTWLNTYAVTYSASTKKFTLARDTGSADFELPWTNASYTGRTLGTDIGFNVAADDTGATSYTADEAAYQSRHWVEIDLQDAPAIKAAVVINHNARDTADVHKIQANDEPFWEDTPDYEGTLAAANDPDRIRLLFFTRQNKRFWRFLIDDVQNPDGFSEMGIIWLSSYFQPTRPHRQGMNFPRQELSAIGFSDHGAPFFDDKPTVHGWDLTFDPVITADKDLFIEVFDYLKRSRCFFVALDATTTPDNTWYVFLPRGGEISHVAGDVWSVGMGVARAPL